MNFFTSDIHFGDEQTLRIDLRPFKNTKEFDKFVLKTWNKQAKKNDTIFILGDMVDCDGAGFDSWKKPLAYVKKIKADVVLILGNNEERVIKHYFDNNFEAFKNHCLSLGFKDVCKNMTVQVAGEEFFLVHKPVDCKKGRLNLFGHVHASGGIFRPFGFNVGCDSHAYRLYSEDDIKMLLRNKAKYWDADENMYFSRPKKKKDEV